MIRITADSTADIGDFSVKRNIALMPLNVILGTEIYSDGVDITPQDIFDFVSKTGVLPKTSAPNVESYENFLENSLRRAISLST